MPSEEVPVSPSPAFALAAGATLLGPGWPWVAAGGGVAALGASPMGDAAGASASVGEGTDGAGLVLKARMPPQINAMAATIPIANSATG